MKAVFSFAGLNLNTIFQEEKAKPMDVLRMMF